MLEYDDADIRKIELGKLIGVEDQVWVQIEGFKKVYAIADEDLERSNEEKTSSVHFLRFELDPDMIAAFKQTQVLYAGCDHPNMRVEGIKISSETAASLCEDLSI